MSKNRSEVKKEYRWATEDMFATIKEWNETFEKVDKAIDFKKYQGKLGNKADFLAF